MGLEKVTYVDGTTVITAQNLNAIQDSIIDLETSRTVPSNVRNAIYTLLENATYATTGLEDEIAVVEAWAEEITSLTLSVSTLSLNSDVPQVITATTIPNGSAVTWSSSNNSVATVSDGVVTGVGNGSCVITAYAGELVATCDVTVSGFVELVSISAVYTPTNPVYIYDSIESLRDDLVVTALYSDSSSATVTSYTLSGTLVDNGTSTITVAYGGKITTFDVNVTTIWVNNVATITKDSLIRKMTDGNYPYYVNSNNRVSYIGMDLNASADYDYKFEYTTTYSGSTNIGVQWLTPQGYDKVIAHRNLIPMGSSLQNADRGDSAWQSNGWTLLHTLPANGIKLLWFTFRAGSGSTSITVDNFPTITITRTPVE